MSLLPPFTRKHYFDMVRVWTGRDDAHRASLEPHCRFVVIEHPPTRRPFGPEADAILELHQPTREALDLLAVFARGRMAIINKVEVALDLLTDSFEDAQALWEYLDLHLIQRWHGGDSVKYVGGTRYTRGRRWGQRQLVMYADHKAAAKNDGRPTCHLELRASSAPHVKRLGLESPAQLLSLDHDAFWRRHLVLEKPDVRLIGRQARGRARAKKPDIRSCYGGKASYDADVRVGSLLTRAAAQTERGPTAQDVRDSLGDYSWFRPASAMRRLSSAPFVPAAEDPLIKVPNLRFPSTPGTASLGAATTHTKEPSHD